MKLVVVWGPVFLLIFGSPPGVLRGGDSGPCNTAGAADDNVALGSDDDDDDGDVDEDGDDDDRGDGDEDDDGGDGQVDDDGEYPDDVGAGVGKYCDAVLY